MNRLIIELTCLLLRFPQDFLSREIEIFFYTPAGYWNQTDDHRIQMRCKVSKQEDLTKLLSSLKQRYSCAPMKTQFSEEPCGNTV